VKKCKVIIFHPALAPYRIDLFNSLSEKCKLKVVFLKENLQSQKFNQKALASQLRCDYQYLVNGFNLKTHCFRFGISTIINDFNPDIIVTHEFSIQSLYLSLRRFWKPFFAKPSKIFIIWTTDSVDIFNNCRLARRVARRFCLDHIDGLLTYSENTKRCYSDYGYQNTLIGILPNIQSDISLRKKIENGYKAALVHMAKYDLQEKKVILYVGRLTNVKNLTFLLQGFSKIENSETKLVIVGEGDQGEKLKMLARELGIEDKVVLAGRYEGAELYAWYRIGNLFVLPSTFEPYGAVVNEALAAGLPCLVSNIAGAATLITDPSQGELFSPFQLDRFAYLLEKNLKKTPPRKLEKHSLPPSLQRISLDHTTDRLVDFFTVVQREKDAQL
jgi:glycosyltransferase involved in cell wall biosynthesis